MKPFSFAQQISNIVADEICDNQCLVRLTFDDLVRNQQETLLAAAMREAGNLAYEFLTDAPNTDAVLGLMLIIAENQDNWPAKQAALQKLGETLINNAVLLLKGRINRALEAEVDHINNNILGAVYA
jgi:hypothetical protein